jgi:hypothetical protein
LEISGFPASNEYEFGKLFANAVVEGLIFLIAIVTKAGEYTLEGGLINISETGTYFALKPIGNETPNTMSLDYEDIKTLDIKFIPDGLYDEIDRRIDKYIDEALGGDY